MLPVAETLVEALVLWCDECADLAEASCLTTHGPNGGVGHRRAFLAHASPEVKREVLRTLLGEGRYYCLFCRTDWVEKCQQRGHRKWLLVDPHLAPEVQP